VRTLGDFRIEFSFIRSTLRVKTVTSLKSCSAGGTTTLRESLGKEKRSIAMTAVKEGLTEERERAGDAGPIDELPPEVRVPPARPFSASKPSPDVIPRRVGAPTDRAFPLLPAQIMYHILSFLPRSAGTANALVGVCKGWREAILGDEDYLSSLKFSLDTSQPFRGMETVRGAVAHRRTWAYADRHNRAAIGGGTTRVHTAGKGATVPALLLRASEVGANATALETIAVLREAQGDVATAYRSWRKAASLGSCLAQFKLGEIFYRGLGNQGVDGEEALFWLNKSMKGDKLAVECRATAAGIMGFLHLDGEGTQACNQSAIKWFKVAADNGCAEALKTLGWLYSTGQY